MQMETWDDRVSHSTVSRAVREPANIVSTAETCSMGADMAQSWWEGHAEPASTAFR